MGNLHISQRKERFSIAYVEALASAAGYAVQNVDVDMFGVDLEIRDGVSRVDVQMKCTASVSSGNLIPFDLDSATHNKLCGSNRILPAYLFLVEVPEETSDWVTCTEDGLHLYKWGYYHAMVNEEPTNNASTKRLYISRTNRLTVETLDYLMKDAAW